MDWNKLPLEERQSALGRWLSHKGMGDVRSSLLGLPQIIDADRRDILDWLEWGWDSPRAGADLFDWSSLREIERVGNIINDVYAVGEWILFLEEGGFLSRGKRAMWHSGAFSASVGAHTIHGERGSSRGIDPITYEWLITQSPTLRGLLDEAGARQDGDDFHTRMEERRRRLKVWRTSRNLNAATWRVGY